MYRVAFTFKGHGLEPVLDKLLNVDGLSELTVDKLRPKTNGPAASDAPKGKRKVRRGKRMEEHKDTVVDVIRQTFQGQRFEPKQILAVVEQRGTPKGTFYHVLAALKRDGTIKRPKPGFYQLAKSKESSHVKAEA